MRYDYVVCDLAAGLDHGVRRMAACADQLMVVVTDEPTSLTDAYAVLKLRSQDHPEEANDADMRIVVNQARTAAAGAHTYETLRKACATFLGREPPLAGVIRHDPKVRDAIRRQTPLLSAHPNAAAAEDVTALAETLL